MFINIWENNVLATGLEPVTLYWERILNPSCLPFSPSEH